MSSTIRRHATCLSLLLLTCALIEPQRARSQVVDSLRVTVTASAPMPPVARLQETVTVGLAATVSPPGGTPINSMGPYTSALQGPVWTWKVKSARYRTEGGAWQDAPAGTYPMSIDAPDTGSGMVFARVACTLPGTWKIAVTATAKYSITGGQTWSGTNEASIVFAVGPPGLSITATNNAICAGGKATPSHRTTLTAALIGSSGTPQAGVLLNFLASDGSLDSQMAVTDASGRATVTLTSSAAASNLSSTPPFVYKATVSVRGPGTQGQVDVEFRPPDCALYAVSMNVEAGDTATLRVQTTWQGKGVANHAIAWRVSRIWDAEGGLVYNGFGEPPPDYGALFNDPVSVTDVDGKCLANFVGGTQGGTVEIEAADKDVKMKPGDASPKADKKINVAMPTATIVPDLNQAGVTGDTVPSTKGKGGLKHYVSPKQGGSFVVLKATLKAGTKFDDVFEWEGGVAIKKGGPPEMRQVSRDAPQKFVVKVKLKKGGAVVDTMTVWIVWAKIYPIRLQNISVTYPLVTPFKGKRQPGVRAESTWVHVAVIEPVGIWKEADIPDFTGPNTQDVPGATKKHIATAILLGQGAGARWDMSRQLRIKNLGCVLRFGHLRLGGEFILIVCPLGARRGTGP